MGSSVIRGPTAPSKDFLPADLRTAKNLSPLLAKDSPFWVQRKKAILSKMRVLKQNLHETLKMYIIWFDYLNKMCRIFFVEILLFHLLFINWLAISNYVYFKFVAFTYSNECLIIFSCSNILLLVALESSKRIMGRPMIFRLTIKVRTASAHARREQWSIADL